MTAQRLDRGIQSGTIVGLLAILLAAPVLAAPASARVNPDYGKLPLGFEANLGQTDEQVKFLSRGPGYTIFLTPSEAVLSLRKTEGEKVTQQVVRMTAVGVNPAAAMTALDELPGKSNYFIGGDPTLWRTGVPSYSRVRYREVYPGIDLVFYGNQRRLEYDFVVAPGADPSRIRLAFEGIEGMRIDEQGDLVLEVPGSELRQHPPVVYQEAGEGIREAVSGQFVLKGQNEVAFVVAPYDHTRPVVIDPSLDYSTYLGGSIGSDIGRAIAVDSMGFAYVTGETQSSDFPQPSPCSAFDCSSNGGQDIFVAKINQGGTALVYSTYVGGSTNDVGHAIAIDGSGNAYVAGYTTSSFPTVNGWDTSFSGSNDGVFFKLNANGDTLLYSTYIGGDLDDQAFGIAVDSATGQAWVTGRISSSAGTLEALPGTFVPVQAERSGARDAFVARFDPGAAGPASLLYFTYLGGSGTEDGRAIALSPSGAYVTGVTTTLNTDPNPLNNFPSATNAGFQTTKPNGGPQGDVFVSKIDPSAAPSHHVYFTYLGSTTDTNDEGRAIAVTSTDVYVAGTSANNFPALGPFPFTVVTPVNGYGGGSSDAFVTKLNLALSTVAFTTFVGGSGVDQGLAMRVDSAGNVFVAGAANSLSAATFPLLNPIQAAYGGGIFDAFLTKLNSSLTRVYSTFLGGGANDQAMAMAVLGSGTVFLTGQTQSSAPTPFPTTAGVLQGAHANPVSFDAFVTKIKDNQPPIANAGPDQTLECTGAPPNCRLVTLNGSGSSDPDGDALTYTWTWSGGPLTGATPTVTIPSLGSHVFTLVVNDGQVNSTPDTVTITVVDTTAPTITSLTATPNTLTPPNGWMIDIAIVAVATDTCDTTPTITLEEITSNETLDAGDIQDAAYGTADFSFKLRARRSGNTDAGRVYTIKYKAVDGAANQSLPATVQVTVPHSQSN